MLYEMLRAPLSMLFTAFYRRIHFSGMENFPKDGATIVATNHSTACVEQMLVATFQKRGVYFWARANVFPKSEALKWLFEQGHMVPIHRREEGLKKMTQNKQIFDLSSELLLKNKVLYIAPEGNCVLEKRLRTFKTGTARIALQTAASTNFEQDVKIVPSGVNYTSHTDFRSDVMVSFGKPLSMLDYKELYLENPSKAIRKVNEDLKLAVRKEMVYIEEKEDEGLTENLFTIFRNNEEDGIFPLVTTERDRLEMEQGLANMVNEMQEESKTDLDTKVTAYFQNLEEASLEDVAVGGKNPNNWLRTFGLLSFFPIALAGKIGGYIPMKTARYLRNSKVKDMQFWAPLAIVFGGATWTAYSIVLTGIAAFFLGWWSLAVAPAAVLGEYVSIYYRESWEKWLANFNYNNWKRSNPTEAMELEAQREEIVKEVETMVVEA